MSALEFIYTQLPNFATWVLFTSKIILKHLPGMLWNFCVFHLLVLNIFSCCSLFSRLRLGCAYHDFVWKLMRLTNYSIGKLEPSEGREFIFPFQQSQLYSWRRKHYQELCIQLTEEIVWVAIWNFCLQCCVTTSEGTSINWVPTT